MGERPAVRLDDDDMIAGAQILAWIARPHRPDSAMKILDHWRRELQRGWGRPDPVPGASLMRRNLIERQFRRLEWQCLGGFRAGQWFQTAILQRAPHPWFDAFTDGVTRLATARVDGGASAISNEMRAWSNRKPVAHLCLSSGNALGRWLYHRELHGFGLSGALLHPTWVSEAIDMSEQWARDMPGQIDVRKAVRFHRDTF